MTWCGLAAADTCSNMTPHTGLTRDMLKAHLEHSSLMGTTFSPSQRSKAVGPPAVSKYLIHTAASPASSRGGELQMPKEGMDMIL